MKTLWYILLANVIILSGCNAFSKRSSQDNLDKIERFRWAFYETGDTSLKTILKEFNIENKSLSQIVDELGKPVMEYMDTFQYGPLIRYNNWLDEGYDYFPRTFDTIPFMEVHSMKWPLGDSGTLALYLVADSDSIERPIWGYKKYYTPDSTHIPFWALKERNMTISQVKNLLGESEWDGVYTSYYGDQWSQDTNIFSLKDVPEMRLHWYRWEVDSLCTLKLYYPEDEDKETAKPIWGHKWYTVDYMYE